MNWQQQRWRIGWRLWWAAALPALFSLLVLTIGLVERHRQDVTAAWQLRAVASAQQLAAASEFALFVNDDAALEQLVEGAQARDAQLLGIALYGRDHRLRALAGQVSITPAMLGDADIATVGQTDILVVTPVRQRVVAKDDWFYPGAAAAESLGAPSPPLGHVVLRLDLSGLQRDRQAFWGWALALALLALALAGVLAHRIAASVTRPLIHISEVVGRIGRGELDARTEPEQRGVLDALAQGVDAMAGAVASDQARLEQRVRVATEELRHQKEEAERQARVDLLTGLGTRRAFIEAAQAEVLRAHRYDEPLALLMFDLDHFKTINDTFGHAAGDAVLATFGHDMAAGVREIDVTARLGGEEFVALLPRCDLASAQAAAERVRHLTEQRQLQQQQRSIRVTVSVGLAMLHPQDNDWEALLARADQALYEAKRNGRNQVVIAQPPAAAD